MPPTLTVKLPPKYAALAALADISYSAAVIRDPDTPTPDRSHHPGNE
jgi:hypothetical protein